MSSVDKGPPSDREVALLMEESERRSRETPVPTLGELFPDGSAMDRLHGDQLILWSQGQ